MKAPYLIIQCELTYYCVNSAVSLEQGGGGVGRSLPAAFAHGVPGERYPGGAALLPHPLVPPIPGSQSLQHQFPNLRLDLEASPLGYCCPPPAAHPGAPTDPHWGHTSPPPDTGTAPRAAAKSRSLSPSLLLLLLPPRQRCGQPSRASELSLHGVMRKLSCRSAVYQGNIHYRWHFVCAKQRP